jgi:hypothetical protein
MHRSAVVAGVAVVVALCMPGTALAQPGPHRTAGHVLYTCLTVRDRARHDSGRICINAFMNPHDQEFHFRARVTFTSTSSRKLARVSAASLYLRLGHRKYGRRNSPRASAAHGARVLRMFTVWVPDPRQLNPWAVVRNACMTWRNGGRACHRGYFRGDEPGYISS